MFTTFTTKGAVNGGLEEQGKGLLLTRDKGGQRGKHKISELLSHRQRVSSGILQGWYGTTVFHVSGPISSWAQGQTQPSMKPAQAQL